MTAEVKRRETTMRTVRGVREATRKSVADSRNFNFHDDDNRDENNLVSSLRKPDAAIRETIEDFEENEIADENLDRPFQRCPALRPDLTMSSIDLCGLLGRGSFGRVHLARSIDCPDEIYALKVMTRYVIVMNGWERNVENERDSMNELAAAVNSPFLLKLWNSFTDSKNIYLLLEICEGGDLFKLMSTGKASGHFDEDEARFYLGCVVLGLEAMHSLDIIYRDLKPENLMVTESGYIKIADFGLAKKTQRTFTMCGTPEYMAPETLLSRGHNAGADWWALGIMLYELLVGVTPFAGGESVDVCQAILAHKAVDDLKFDKSTALSQPATDFIIQLLHPKKHKRLGVKYPGVEGVKT
ncbi:MAG TPA: protein kinase, partial [Blastocatellia bacterium]|nr:protein kinase [Blastocatellia bacterium]